LTFTLSGEGAARVLVGWVEDKLDDCALCGTLFEVEIIWPKDR
jgi:hypothetical protein